MSTHEKLPRAVNGEDVAPEKVPVNKITPEALAENSEQDEQERRNVEGLIAAEIEARADWSQELRSYLSEYLRRHAGQWRECDGDYVKFLGFSLILRKERLKQYLKHMEIK